VTGVVVVGGSIGGVRTIQQLRRMGYAGTITLVESQTHLPYDRPPLSKAVLEGDEQGLPTLLPVDQAADLRVDLVLGVPATSLDTNLRRLHLADGSSLDYEDALVVATGARARRSPWSGTTGVHELRGWDDAVALRSALSEANRIVVVGAGFIGAEVASAARKRGLHVDIVDVAPVPMARHFGADVGSLFVDLHVTNGTVPHFGTGVAELTGSGAGVTVSLGDGTCLEADLAVVGVGTELNTEWLDGSGIKVDDGVVCDRASRADVGAAVYAVGDVARWWHPVRDGLVRSEHWTNAVEQATVVAHNITQPGDLRDHSPIGYVWSNQYDWKIQIAGDPARGIRHVLVREGPARFLGLWADEHDLLCGVLTVNWQQLSVRGRQALAAGLDLAATHSLMFPGGTTDSEPATPTGAVR
jgi:NADPH-dependent 2,4-dienoyl-CoA reductase/sulfur reductase-like enzyme